MASLSDRPTETKLPMAMADEPMASRGSAQQRAARRPRPREGVLGVARAPRPGVGRHLPRVPPDAAVVLAQVGGQIAAVVRAGIADRAERSAPVPHEPAAGQSIEVLAAAAQLPLEAALRLVVRDGVAELTAEDHPDGHGAYTRGSEWP